MISNYDKCYTGNQHGAWENPTFDKWLRKFSLRKWHLRPKDEEKPVVLKAAEVLLEEHGQKL